MKTSLQNNIVFYNAEHSVYGVMIQYMKTCKDKYISSYIPFVMSENQWNLIKTGSEGQCTTPASPSFTAVPGPHRVRSKH